MVHVHPRWPVLILEVVESSGAVEEEDTEAVAVDPGLVEDTEEVEDTRVVEAASEDQEGIVAVVVVAEAAAVGVDTGGMVGVVSGDLVGVVSGDLVDTEDLMGVEDIEEVVVEEEVEDMEGGDSEVGGAETGVVIKAECLNIFEMVENYVCFVALCWFSTFSHFIV